MLDLEKIKEILVSTSTITDELIELTLNRLKALTYEVQESDAFSIAFLLQKIENTIKHECNVDVIPEGLYFIAADMVCGEFLMNKRATNSLDGSFDINGLFKTVKVGDVNVQLDESTSDDKKLLDLCNYLMSYGLGEFIRYRKMIW